MPNAIKYSTDTQTLALKKGNYWIGTGDVGKGPTSSTDYWNGITPPTGGYTIYLNKASNGPSIYTPSNDSQLITITNRIAGASYTTINECFNYFNGQSDKMVVNRDVEGIVTDGLQLYLDAGLLPSYPQNGTTWTDLTGLRTATINGSYSFNTGNGGYFDGFGINSSYITINNPPTATISAATIQCVVMYTDTQLENYSILRFRNSSNAEVKLGGDFNSFNNIIMLLFNGRFTKFTLNQNVWNFVSAVGNTSNLSTNISVNGGARTTTIHETLSPLTSPVAANMISRQDTSQQSLRGRLALVLYYNRALSRVEELQNYNAIRNRFKI